MEAYAVPASPLGRVYWALSDGLTLAVRPLVQFRHRPQILLAALVFPMFMVVLLGYVIGSAMDVPGGGDYREYLMPGLFVMMSFTGVATNATDVAADCDRGITERLHSMPMSRLAVPFGQTGADFMIGTISLTLMLGCGVAVGWEPREGVLRTAAGIGLILLLRYAMSWVGVFIGLKAGSGRMAERLAPFFFPAAMISTSFVPTDGMPAWLRTIANWNPVSANVTACRDLFGNPGSTPAHAPLPLQHPVTATLLWSAALLVVFVPLTVRAYRLKGR